jgi:DNA primase
MARIADEVIERIKSEVSLVRLVESQGYKLQKQGKDFALCCPFHEDKTPSCVITPKSNLFNCFGCGAGGSVIDWVMKTQGVSFRHAVELLKNDIAAITSSSVANVEPVKKTTVPKLAAPVSADVNDQELLREVVNYYHETLLQAPEALDYLQKRGLDDAELLNEFKLGYANRTLGLRLPQKNRKAGSELREKLQRVGVYRESGHEHLNGSIVVPLLNEAGDVVQLYGRKILDNLREGTAYHLYLPSPQAGVFNYAGLVGCEEIILCEALIDALTFWRWGFKNVTSSYGVNGFTDEILQTFIRLKIKRVLIAYDRDEAGNNGALEVAKKLNQHGIDAFRVLFPKGMDANQYAVQMVPAPKALALVIRSAQWLGNGVVPEITTARMQEVEQRKEQLPTTQLIEDDKPFLSVAAVDEIDQILGPEVIAEIEKLAILVNALDGSASPVPPLSTSTVLLESREDGLFLNLGERLYRIRGLDKNASTDQLKVQLMVQCGEAFFIDKLDLYSSKQRQIFINQACVELGISDEIIKKDLGKLLLALEQEQLKKSDDDKSLSPTQLLSNEDREAALNLLRDKNLPQRILNDFATAGVVGEETNKLVGYLASVSRKLDRPLAIVIQSSSAAGKSSLMDAVLAFMPEDERVQYSAMTGQSLFYMGETRLKNKILAISEEEGAHTASYALKLLQSEGEVTIASTGKDDSSGQLVTREYKVEGPVMLFLTTTAIDIDEELLNRCLVLTVNESREQTEAIHHAQRLKRTLKGLESKIEKSRILQLHRNAQRLLKSLTVINPYADQLTFLADKTRTRRDHEKYLTLIDSIALLHQYQREIKKLGALDYIEVTPQDIALANRLAHEVLGKTLDELPPQTRQLLNIINTGVSADCKAHGIDQRDFRFSRRYVRELCGWSETQVRVHMQRLMAMEYLLTHRGHRGQSFDYELLYNGEGKSGDHFMMGLLDVEQLTENKNNQNNQKNNTTTESSRDEVVGFAGSTRPQRGGIAEDESEVNASAGAALPELQKDSAENAYLAV